MTNEQTQPQTDMNDWLKQELEQTKAPATLDRLPTLKLESGKVITFEVDTTKPFGEYRDPEKGGVKKIIPVDVKGVKHNLWLNVKNPLYRQILDKLVAGQNKMYVSTTGTKEKTRYELVEFN